MRLQLQILRHSLPPVHVLHTTGTGPTSHTRSRDSTIADLLQDINDIVPLESSDGEWGLEDYVVEVAATADQEIAYECLHYQTCEAVLREDDEVVIRALSTEDLRVRRLGGRHQITSDGRHLVDGIAFGKQWLRRTGRPGITIPPRKRRRLEIDDAAFEEEVKIPLLLPPEESHSGTLVTRPDFHDYEDEEDDADFVDDEDEDDDEDSQDDEVDTDADSNADEELHAENHLQVAIREDFDDADQPSADESHSSVDDDNSEYDSGSDLPEELRLLLRDAAEAGEAGDVATGVEIVRAQLKRKREQDDDGDQPQGEIFEGFSTPVKSSGGSFPAARPVAEDDSDAEGDSDSDSLMPEIALDQASTVPLNILPHEEHHDDTDSDASSKTSSTASSSSSDSDDDSLIFESAKARVLNLVRLPGEYTTSESDSSEDDEEYGTSSSESEAGSESTESDSDTSSDSDSEQEAQEKVPREKVNAPQSSSSIGPNSSNVTAVTKPTTSAPGEGSTRTRNNNARQKKKKRLSLLKSQGLLPEGADFRALANYESREEGVIITPTSGTVQKPTTAQTPVEIPQASVAGEAQAVKAVEAVEAVVLADAPVLPSEDSASATAAADSLSAQIPDGSTTQESPSSSSRRHKLDLASSRRMLFSALGVRPPKDKTAEAALREKLSKQIRPLKSTTNAESRIRGAAPTMGGSIEDAAMQSESSWQDKLIVSAVECERDGMRLPPPPFPFQQGWAKGAANQTSRNKRRGRDDQQYYQGSEGVTSLIPDVSTLDYDDKPTDEATGNVISIQGDDGIPVPHGLDGLRDLEVGHIRPGAVIAYKELQLDQSTNYQPEVSAYKVARVEALGSEAGIQVLLARQFWAKPSEVQYDEVSGNKRTDKFKLQSEDDPDDPDDGYREITFNSMISPKLVEQSSVEVPNSSHATNLRGGGRDLSAQADEQDDPEIIPESAEPLNVEPNHQTSSCGIEQVEVATPQRNAISEIIKEAGFESALAEELLRPLQDPSDSEHRVDSLVEPSSPLREEYPHRFRHLSSRIDEAQAELESSSQIDSHAQNLTGVEESDSLFPLESGQTSSPYMHTQETVEYPHISQIEINSTGSIKATNSSSHQDAQRVSPAPEMNLSFAVSEHDNVPIVEEPHNDHNDSIGEGANQNFPFPSSLPSEVPQSPSQNAEDTSGRADELEQPSSFLGDRGYDGPTSSYQGNAPSDYDSDLPSITELTSSQQNRKLARSSVRVEFPIKKSSSPAGRQLRSSKSNNRLTPASSPEASDIPSSPVIKLSQSQRLPRLSQIPAGSQVVDLTLTSDASSPIKQNQTFASNETGRNSQTRGSRKSGPKATNQASGIGSRRLLTTKKRSYF